MIPFNPNAFETGLFKYLSEFVRLNWGDIRHILICAHQFGGYQLWRDPTPGGVPSESRLIQDILKGSHFFRFFQK